MSKQNFINELSKENSTFSTTRQAEMVASLLNTVSTDIYSESQRFVFELIQNADDAAENEENEVHFDFFSNCLIVSHNGKPFDENDIISLTGAGASTKKSDPTKTGYKGIGFKSVFGKSERVTIFSGGYQFRFDKSNHTTILPWQIIPFWTEKTDFPEEIQNCETIGKYNVSTIIELKQAKSLIDDLNELLDNGQILLFLRRISKISVSKENNVISSIQKQSIKQDDGYFNEITLFKDKKVISSWITKSFKEIPITSETKEALIHDDKTPDKLKEADFTEITFAAMVEDGKIKSLKNNESLIFTYLPTKVSEFDFPFLVNGSFLTNAAREGLHEDRIWNQWLFSLVAIKLLEWFEFLSQSKFKFQILHLLPKRFNTSHNALKVAFDKSIESSIKEKIFVPDKSSKLKKVSELVIDKTGLSDVNFISPETVVEYINLKEKTDFKGDSFINPKLQRADKLISFNTYVFASDNLEPFFQSSVFQENHQTSENFSLIEYFYNKAKNDESKEWHEKLKDISFIYVTEKVLKKPKTVCFPSMSFETEFGDGVTLIHSEVYSKIEINSKIKNWLEQLGVKEPSDNAYLENEIIGNIDNSITNENFLRVTRFIFNQSKKDKLTDWHFEKLQNLKLSTTSKEFKAAKECYLSDFYEPSLNLEKVNSQGKFVSEVYKQQSDFISEWKTFFLKIGVSENISIIKIETSIHENNGIEEQYFKDVGKEAKQGHRYPHLVDSTNSVRLDKIRYSEFATDYKFSKVFWHQAIKTIKIDEVRQYASMPWGYYGNSCSVSNYFYWCIANSKIFPATTKECLKAEQLFINSKEINEM